LVKVKKHITSSADEPCFILKVEGTIPRGKANPSEPIQLFIIEGEEFVYDVEDWRPTEELCVGEATPLALRR